VSPKKARTLRWGVLGTGRIAGEFASDLALLGDQRVEAVGSRSLETARAFAGAHAVPRFYGSYQELVNDPDIDIVYVATPHSAHCPNALLALAAGKPVLVEKPFALDATEARAMVALAREKRLFLLEAMWMRFLPHIRSVQAILARGAIGEVMSVQADHGWWFERDPRHRLFAPELGGGALLDLGIYPVSLATLVLGLPDQIASTTTPAFTGVDAQVSIAMRYPGGAQALLHTTLLATVGNQARITGTLGRIEIDPIFYTPTGFTVVDRDGAVLERHERNYTGHGLRESAVEAARCLRLGLLESPLMPLDETIAILGILDTIRSQAKAQP